MNIEKFKEDANKIISEMTLEEMEEFFTSLKGERLKQEQGKKQYRITKISFLNWYFYSGSDSENEEIRQDLTNAIIGHLYRVGAGFISVQALFEECNQEAIKVGYCLDEDKEDERELQDLDIEYTVILI